MKRIVFHSRVGAAGPASPFPNQTLAVRLIKSSELPMIQSLALYLKIEALKSQQTNPNAPFLSF
jgi:hypothetical protein